MSVAGIVARSAATRVLANTVTGGPVGIRFEASGAGGVVANNLVTGTSDAAIHVTGGAVATQVLNNTLIFSTGIGALLNANASGAYVANNIISASGGVGIVLDRSATQSVGSARNRANYNLFDLSGTAIFGRVADTSFASLDQWALATGLDEDSLAGTPGFVNAAANDYRLQASSIGIDRGDPLSAYGAEPGQNGSRVNIGHHGNTALATVGQPESVQVLSPNGLEKFERDQAMKITWRTSGLAPEELVGLYATNFGRYADPMTVIAGEQSWAAWRATRPAAAVGSYTTIDAATALDTSATPGVPEAIFRTQAISDGGAGNGLSYSVDVPDGTYRLRLYFVEIFGYNHGGVNVVIEGTTRADNYNLFAATGARYRTASLTYDVTVTGGKLDLSVVSRDGNQVTLAGFEISKLTGVAPQTARVEVSPDNGATWTLVATDATMDRYGYGSTVWSTGFDTNANSVLARVTVGNSRDVSDKPFLTTNAGRFFYVDDASNSGDQYTPGAIGDNLNSGKTADRPMASLEALLRAYKLQAGDVVYVDTGNYTQLYDIVFDGDDAGSGADTASRLRIQGPTGAAQAVLNRDATGVESAVFRFTGADFITLSDLEMTGARNGIYFNYQAGSNFISVLDSQIYGNARGGISFDSAGGAQINQNLEVGGTRIFNHANGYGIYDFYSTANLTVHDSEIFGNNYGLHIYGSQGGSISNSVIRDNEYGAYLYSQNGTLVVSGNRFANNRNTGLELLGGTASDNTVSGSASYSSSAGIRASNSGARTLVTNNIVFDNTAGIVATGNAVIDSNRIFRNAQSGVRIDGQKVTVEANRIYSNLVGISSTYSALDARILSNLIYANADAGISFNNAGAYTRIIAGNTIYQSVGDGILLTGNSPNTQIVSNILWNDLGRILNISAGSQSGLVLGTNIFYRGLSGAANVAVWGATAAASLANFRSASGLAMAGSLEGDPSFIDINGSDNVLGGADTATGGGADDNFGLKRGSIAIDAGEGFVDRRTDFLGLPRSNDPSVADTGNGYALYQEGVAAGSSFNPAGGTALNHRTSYGNRAVTLPFAFNFYGTSYTTIYVNTDGFIDFADNQPYAVDSTDELKNRVRIAPFWEETLYTYGSGNDVFVDSSVADQVTVRWNASAFLNGTPQANFSVTLFADGRIRFDYGSGNQGMTPTIGLSAGNGYTFVSASYSGSGALQNAASLTFTPNAAEGLDYFDIGAIEFQGASNDATPPRVVSIPVLPAEGGSTAAAFNRISIGFSESLEQISALSAANYELRYAGANGIFGDADDRTIALRPSYSFPETALVLDLVDGPLADGRYQLIVRGSDDRAVYDTAGNRLDGDNNGSAGGDFIRNFIVDRSVNRAPVAAPAAVTVGEDGSLLIQFGATDADSDPLTYELIGLPQHGTLSGFEAATGRVTYRPDANFSGTDTLRFRVSDGKLGVSEALVTITVTPVNDRPTGNAQTVSAIAGEERTIILTGSDLETAPAALVASIVTGPAHGTLVLDAGNVVRYIPSPTYAGTDSFTFRMRDSGDPAGTAGNATDSELVTVTITVTNPNDAPVAVRDDLTATVDVPLAIPVGVLLSNDRDPDGTTPTLTAVFGAVNGTVALSGGVVTFTPAAGHIGSASFQYRISDGEFTAVGEVRITVEPFNAPPVADDDLLLGTEDQPVAIPFATLLAGDVDPEGQPLSVLGIVPGSATGGVVTFDPANGRIVFTPNADVNGDQGFDYILSDGGRTDIGHVTVRLAPANDAPTAGPVAVSTAEDNAATIQAATLLAATGDVDGDARSLLSVGNATAGTVQLSAGVVTFTPAANFAGIAGFDYTVSDGKGGQATGRVTVTVTPVNDAPVAVADSLAGTEDTVLTIGAGGLVANDTDVDGDTLTVTAVSDAVGGTVSLNGAQIVFSPASNLTGPVSFRYTVSDGHGGTSSALVTITLAAVNDAPVAVDDSLSTDNRSTLSITRAALLANDSDVDSTISVTDLVTAVVGGTVQVQSDRFVFTPQSGFVGLGGFTYRITDGALTATGRVNITIGEGNHAPVAVADTLATNEDEPLTINAADLLANDTDADGDALTITLGAAQNGTVTETAPGIYRFTPTANFHGAASFGYTIADGKGGQSQAVVTITVAPVNDAPAPVNDTVTTAEDTTIRVRFSDLLANDVDSDGDALRVVAVSNATGGSFGELCLPCGRIDFVPAANFNGVGGFDYTVEDAAGVQRTAHVTVTVTAINDAPVAADDSLNSLAGAVLDIDPATLTANDADVENNPLSVIAVSNPANGTVSLSGGRIRFEPAAGFLGVAGFDVTISDGAGGTATSHVTVTVTAVNAAPVAVDDVLTLRFGDPLRITAAMLTANDSDADGDPLTLVSLSNPSIGTLSAQADGSYIFNAPALSAADATLTYVIADGRGGTDSGRLTIRPQANRAPVVVATSASTPEDTPLVVSIASLLANASDADGDALSLISVRGERGTTLIDRAAGTVTFTPAANATGLARLYYKVGDGRSATEGHVDITATPVNDAPTAATARFAGRPGQTLRIDPAALLARASDSDGDVLSLASVAQRYGGTVSIEAGTGMVLFTPTATGTTSFVYTVTDGTATASAIASVDVPLMAVTDSLVTTVGTPLVIQAAALLANDAGLPGDVITLVSVQGASNGAVSYDAGAGTITFTPTAGFAGRALFRYTASFSGTPATALVNVQVVNGQAPSAVMDTVRTVAGQPIEIDPALLTANDVVAPGNSLSISAVGGATNGAVALSGGKITFTPAAGFTGTTFFTYTVSAGGQSAVGQVRVLVGANAAPVSVARDFNTAEDTVLTLSEASLLTAFRDPDGFPLRVVSVANAVSGTVSFDAASRQTTYTPTANFNGRDRFDVTVSDGVNQMTASVTVRVTPVDDRPVMTPLTLKTVPAGRCRCPSPPWWIVWSIRIWKPSASAAWPAPPMAADPTISPPAC